MNFHLFIFLFIVYLDGTLGVNFQAVNFFTNINFQRFPYPYLFIPTLFSSALLNPGITSVCSKYHKIWSYS